MLARTICSGCGRSVALSRASATGLRPHRTAPRPEGTLAQLTRRGWKPAPWCDGPTRQLALPL